MEVDRANLDIRNELTKANVKQWELADGLNISEPTLTRWLRHELSENKKAHLLSVIRQIAFQKTKTT